jgi:hypothetical protein
MTMGVQSRKCETFGGSVIALLWSNIEELKSQAFPVGAAVYIIV